MSNFKKIIPILIGTNYLCFGCGNRTSSISNNRSNIIDTVTFSAKLSKNIDSKNLSEDIAGGKLKIKGTYHGCFGKGDNSEWNLSEKEDDSNLIFMKNDVNCKIKLNKIEINNENYLINGESNLIEEKYQNKSIEFISLNGKKIYIFSKINPLNLSSKPTVSVIISEVEHNFDNKNLKVQKSEIFEVSKANIKNILVPDYILKANEVDLLQSESNYILYGGSYFFESQNIPGNFYFIVPDKEDVSNFDKLNNLFEKYTLENDRRLVKIDSVSGKNEVEIIAKNIANYAEFPQKLQINDVLKAKIIFVNTDEISKINSFKLFNLSLSITD